MDFQRRRLAPSPENMTLPDMVIGRSLLGSATETETSSIPTSTIGPYGTGLAGVNQPMNLLFKDLLWWTLGAFALVILSFRITVLFWTWIRQMSTMSASGKKQNYWKWKQWSWMPFVKKHLIYAPLWKKRHTKELRLSSALNVGTLPSRFQSLVLGIYVASNIIYMFVLNWSNQNKYAFCAELRGRSGTLALVNMVPLIILAMRNNLLIGLLKISFDTMNLLHRWIGRMVVIETVIHMVAWAIVQFAEGGWDSVVEKLLHNLFIASGTAGTICMVILAILASGPIRHAFYETFLTAHITLAFVIFACTLVHCISPQIPGGLPQLPWIIGIFLLWLAERLVRIIRLVYCNWSERGYTQALVEAMPGEVSRVTMDLPRYVDIKPGSHAYIRFAGVSWWENHPFSIAWVKHHSTGSLLPIDEKQPAGKEKVMKTTVSFIIGAQTGMTRKLYNTALKANQPSIRMRAAFEGPYAGHHCLDSYGHVVLIAGATGITHQLSYLKPLIEGFDNGIVSTRRITLVWIVRDQEALTWCQPWFNEVLNLPKRKDILQVNLFVTRPSSQNDIVSQSRSVRMFPGRPNIRMLLRKEIHEQLGAMCVTVCGPGSLADDVRAATRDVQNEGTVVDFLEESFSW
ncbi:putative FAD binding protein [Coniochaeta sp. PMI_546]|nr:putative FAD binding protein [Coniochaeta sp. PMI_546]